MTAGRGAAFEAMYAEDSDPWQFATSAYEQRRYDLTAASLLRKRYRRAFEPGCSIGELTRRLAARCDRVEAIDVAPSAVARAKRRCAPWPNVGIDVGAVPADWPAGTFDLIVLSEIGYYFDEPGLGGLRHRAVASLEPGGTLVAVHWRGSSAAHVLHGDQVHACLHAGTGLRAAGRYRDDGFVLDLWIRS